MKNSTFILSAFIAWIVLTGNVGTIIHMFNLAWNVKIPFFGTIGNTNTMNVIGPATAPVSSTNPTQGALSEYNSLNNTSQPFTTPFTSGGGG